MFKSRYNIFTLFNEVKLAIMHLHLHLFNQIDFWVIASKLFVEMFKSNQINCYCQKHL